MRKKYYDVYRDLYTISTQVTVLRDELEKLN